ncbi:peptide chain release factor 1 [Chitinispirillales bacterium ANBcel5]|uniref:peptide chain release factor 1 n=1 Tax=Cellulosispirillum alkaliphilum TaxID=3039283 RepID=UPI002A4EF69D|nr:peptide chain release factor 1 [Chitinispirillales bacterium ANBcel5]
MIKEKVKNVLIHHSELEARLASPEVTSDPSKMEKLGREYNSLNKNLPVYKKYLEMVENIESAQELIESESDPELLELAREELYEYQHQLPEIEQEVKILLVPRDPKDLKNAVVEIRAGTGGTEAGIFAADLYRMYTHYVEKRGWSIEVLGSSFGDLGAVKEVIMMIKGENAYGTLKYESGVHRVQRVPQTETQGRVHTSAASVAVFPEADDFEVDIDPNELRIDLFCSSGPGGQSVNTTYSAVRIVHLPTGLTVSCQDEKSQHKNKAKAMKVLQTRLYEQKLAEVEAKESAERKSMVSTGDRSAKIRTYNFPQNRLTDHRMNLTLYSLDSIINGELDELINSLSIADLNEQVKKAGM